MSECPKCKSREFSKGIQIGLKSIFNAISSIFVMG